MAAFQSHFAGDVTDETPPIPEFADVDSSIADYVWLPFRFDGEMAYLDWHDEWRVEDYA